MDQSGVIGEKTEGTLKISYNYNKKTGLGLLENTVPISIDRNCKEEDEFFKIASRELSHRISHPNFLPCFGNDRMDNVNGSTSGNAIYLRYSESLAGFIDRNPPVIQQFKVPAGSNCAEDKKLTYDYIPDVYRQMFRDMIKSLIFLHNEMDASLVELLLEKNFRVTNSRLQMYRLRYKKPASTQSKNKDFRLLVEVIQEVFIRHQIKSSNNKQKNEKEDKKRNKYVSNQNQNKPNHKYNKDKPNNLPPEFEHLLDCMRNYGGSVDDQLLLKNHLVLLRSGKRLEMIKKFREKVASLPLVIGKRFEEVYYAMGRNEPVNPIWEDWTRKLSHPECALIKGCFDSHQSSYKIRGERHTGLNRLLIQFCRNMAEHINTTNIIGQYNNQEAFTEHEVECIIMAAHGKSLVAFQKEAKKHGLLKLLI